MRKEKGKERRERKGREGKKKGRGKRGGNKQVEYYRRRSFCQGRAATTPLPDVLVSVDDAVAGAFSLPVD